MIITEKGDNEYDVTLYMIAYITGQVRCMTSLTTCITQCIMVISTHIPAMNGTHDQLVINAIITLYADQHLLSTICCLRCHLEGDIGREGTRRGEDTKEEGGI